MYNELLKNISTEYEEAAIVQAYMMPWYPYAGGKNKNVFKVARDNSWRHCYIQANTSKKIKAIIIDIDSDISIQQIKAALPDGLLPASVTGLIKKKNYVKFYQRPHIRFNLKYPVKKDNTDQMNWLRALIAALQLKFRMVGAKVDERMPPLVTKNPHSGMWDYETFGEYAFKTWTFEELSRLLDLKALYAQRLLNPFDYGLGNSKGHYRGRRKKVEKPKGADESRNCWIFDTASPYAYGMKRTASSAEEIFQKILPICMDLNFSLEAPLSLNEVKGIAKSISRWTWKNYTGSGNHYNVGAAARYINEEDTIRTKMQKGAYYSHKVRSTKAIKKLAETIQNAQQEGGSITKKGMARKSGLSLPTVQKYWDLAHMGPNVIHITNGDRKLQNSSILKYIFGGETMPPSERDIQDKPADRIEDYTIKNANLSDKTDVICCKTHKLDTEKHQIKEIPAKKTKFLTENIIYMKDNKYYYTLQDDEDIEIPAFLL